MRTSLALRRAAAGHRVSLSRLLARRGCAGKSAPILAAVAGVLAAAGCTPIPIPDTALLERQPAPKCDARVNAKARQQAGASADTGGDAASQAKLDYERQCYRHAELIARNRLNKLQASVQQTVKAVKEGEAKASEVDRP